MKRMEKGEKKKEIKSFELGGRKLLKYWRLLGSSKEREEGRETARLASKREEKKAKFAWCAIVRQRASY